MWYSCTKYYSMYYVYEQSALRIVVWCILRIGSWCDQRYWHSKKVVRHGSSTRTQECAVTALDAPNASPAAESDDAFKWIKECTQNASQPHSTVLSFVSQKQKLKTSNFFWLSHQWNNYFWSTTQTQSNNNNFCYTLFVHYFAVLISFITPTPLRRILQVH